MLENSQSLDTSEHLIDLTYQDTFQSLDYRFVIGCAHLLHARHVRLHLGNHLENINAPILQEYLSSEDKRTHTFETIIPLRMTSGQSLSLFIDKALNEEEQLALYHLITVYTNQYEHLTRSNKDRLTSLKNRRSFDLEYAHLIKQGGEDNDDEQDIIAIVDVDHFKQVNDNYGHIIGDETLVTLANIMKAFFEKDDYLYRFGGEEFIVLLKGMSALEAEIILEQLREEVAHVDFPQIGRKTISIGYVPIRHNEDSALLFERADLALYQAKHDGRNCVKSYDKLVAAGKIKPIESRSGDVELF